METLEIDGTEAGFVKMGQCIQAIKRIRGRLDLDLKTAKDIIDAYRNTHGLLTKRERDAKKIADYDNLLAVFERAETLEANMLRLLPQIPTELCASWIAFRNAIAEVKRG